MALEDPVVCHHGTPKDNAFAITPSDATPLLHLTSHIYVGTTGDLSFVPVGDMNAVPTVVTLAGLAVGWHPVRARLIRATATTCGGLVGFY
jgi:hypothetical protein